MNTKIQIISVLTIVAISIVSLGHINNNVEASIFMPYGSIGNEDQIYTQDENGLYYINTMTNYGIGNGSFEQINEINIRFDINEAIKTFGINEDTQSFIYEPVLSNGEFSNVLFMYELVSFNNFELTHIYEDESGIDEQVTQLENDI